MKNIILVFVVMVLASSGCKYFKKSSKSDIDTLFADTTASITETVDSAALFEEMETYRIGSESEADQAEAMQQTFTNETGNRYYMIVGCFAVPQNAEAYAAKIREMGYNGTILEGSNMLQMVSARSYGNYQESIAEIEKFRNEVTPDAWVYVMK